MRTTPRSAAAGHRHPSWCAALVLLAWLPRPDAAFASTDVDGIWSVLGSPYKVGSTAVYDARRDRMVVFGGSSSEIWALSLAGPPAWMRIVPFESAPVPFEAHAVFYDLPRDRMIVYGGYGAQRGELWALSLAGIPVWTAMYTTGTAPLRVGTAVIYDPVRDRMILFGGNAGGSNMNDTWSLSLDGTPTWTQILPPGGAPPARSGHCALYDPGLDRMLVYGGDGDTALNDVWALDFSGTPAWTRLVPTGSAPPGGTQYAALDVDRNRLLVFGGWRAAGGQTWAFDLGAPRWSLLAPAGQLPPGRLGPALLLDAPRNRLVVAGGCRAGCSTPEPSVWALSLEGTLAWSRMSTQEAPPGGRAAHTAIYDSRRHRMLIYGGLRSDSLLSEVWELAFGGAIKWTRLETTGPAPRRAFHSAVYDRPWDRMIVFGGMDGSSATNEVWALGLSSSPPAWTRLVPGGTEPSGRWGHTAIYDSQRRSMLIFGGFFGGFLADTWALSLDADPTWVELPDLGAAPVGRWQHAAIYDPVRDRMVIFGGDWCGECPRNDVWAFSLANMTWSDLTPDEQGPTGRIAPSAMYDAERDRMVVFGGLEFFAIELRPTNDTWALPLKGSPTWTKLEPTGTLPEPRGRHPAIHDPVGDRLVAFGGDAWWGQLRNDLVMLSWPKSSSSPGASAPRLVLGPTYPNPFNCGTTIAFDLPSPTRVRLRLFDVSGRLVRELSSMELGPGAHQLPWDGRDERGTSANSGVYTCVLEAGAVRQARRLVLIR